MSGAATENPVKSEPAALNHPELVKIIVEEVLRALRARSAAPDGSEPHRDTGIVLFTGVEPVAPPLLDALEALAGRGSRISALPSETFRRRQFSNAPRALRNLPSIENSRCEAALAKAIDAADWLVVPDASSNTLNKAVLGIEDSIPSRAIAQALRTGPDCYFFESMKPPSPESGLERHGLLRRLERRGARLAGPRSLAALIHPAPGTDPHAIYEPPSERRSPRRRIITADDVYEAHRRGKTVLILPADAILTDQAIEDARRRGIPIRREDEG